MLQIITYLIARAWWAYEMGEWYWMNFIIFIIESFFQIKHLLCREQGNVQFNLNKQFEYLV